MLTCSGALPMISHPIYRQLAAFQVVLDKQAKVQIDYDVIPQNRGKEMHKKVLVASLYETMTNKPPMLKFCLIGLKSREMSRLNCGDIFFMTPYIEEGVSGGVENLRASGSKGRNAPGPCPQEIAFYSQGVSDGSESF